MNDYVVRRRFKQPTLDVSMTLQVKEIADTYRGSDVKCSDVTAYDTMMRYLINVVTFDQLHRPSRTSIMQVDGFVKAMRTSNNTMVVLVVEHKTGAQGLAQLALEPEQYKLFQLYLPRFRPTTASSHFPQGWATAKVSPFWQKR